MRDSKHHRLAIDSPEKAGACIGRCTKSVRAVDAKMIELLVEIEREWIARLGAKCFAQLRQLLIRCGKARWLVNGSVRRLNLVSRQLASLRQRASSRDRRIG